ncbi:MFS-type transporter-like protein 36 [Elsinoe fawcettii]|nr:MFS-type transporter-like protein 36 [Elsinoe fawcettii]
MSLPTSHEHDPESHTTSRTLSTSSSTSIKSTEERHNTDSKINLPNTNQNGAEEERNALRPDEKEGPVGNTGDPDLVGWDEDDPLDPKNWKTSYKIFVTGQLGMLALAASTGSSIISPATNTIAQVVGVGQVTAVLSLSLYVLGFAFGPLVFAPVSEVWGRRVSILPPMYVLGIFSIGTAVSSTPAAIFITRFFSGICASAPVSNVSAALGDIYSQAARGTAVTFYALMVVGGPTLGPVIGSAILVNPNMGWRWTQYIQAIWAFTVVIFATIFLPEVYGPVLLKRKAKALRETTNNPNLYHPHERLKLDFKSIVTKQLSRPLKMLFTEPAVACIALYASFVYAILYLTLEVYPIVFSELRGWSPVIASLPFISLFVGVCLAVGINLGNQPRYIRILNANGGKAVPEARLPPLAVGAFLFAIGLFWFGWTADPSVPWPASVCAGVFIGAGFNAIFQQCINFLIDTYTIYAASAVSANTFLRSILAAALPLVARPMFHNLGVGPAMSILGGIATLAIPVPFLFMRYGKELRKRSKFAPYEEDERSGKGGAKKEGV